MKNGTLICVGYTFKSNDGGWWEVVEYNNANDVIVKLMDDNIYYCKKTSNSVIKKGNVKNPYRRSVCGIGYAGDGLYEASKNGIRTNAYKHWKSMIERCYSALVKEKKPSYIECTVCDEWHNFQNFAKWYEENYYEVDGCKMCLDKDILVKGNKVYSPDACVFVPDVINTLFINRKRQRGNLPVGVLFHKRDNIYESKIKINGNSIYLGRYNTPKEAFNVYKKTKESNIKNIADQYKDKIPQKLYEAMCKYEVEITD